jgi:hypothetical protein
MPWCLCRVDVTAFVCADGVFSYKPDIVPVKPRHGFRQGKNSQPVDTVMGKKAPGGA